MMKLKLIPIFAAAALVIPCALPCAAQTAGHAQVFSAKTVAAELATLTQEAKAKGSGGTTLYNYGSHAIELSVRTESGGSEIHAHFDDIFVVTRGHATLITGGTVLNGKTNSATGETEGSGIRGGHAQTIVKGDIVNIPAGTPHQLIIPHHSVYSAIVIKVHEP